jgi:hypothetical protein
MNYVYSPNDIAVFLLKSDFSLSGEQSVLTHLWEEQKNIQKKYRLNKHTLVSAVQREITSYMLANDTDMDELDLIMRDINPNQTLLTTVQEHNCLVHFFKVIRLELLYVENKDFYKIKLRRLLKRFGYKRRSAAFIQDLTRTMSMLSLKPYLRGYVPCDLAKINIDDMVMIRLKRKAQTTDER